MLDILVTVLGILAVICIWIILFDSNRFVVVHHTFTDARIRQPFKVVLLADLHNKQFGRENRALLDAIRREKPDAVLIAGDMLTSHRGKSMEVPIRLLKELAEDYRIYYANGNHEQRLELYPEDYGTMAEDYEKALQEIGIERMINSHADLEQYGIAIYGLQLDELYYKRFRSGKMEDGYLQRLLGKPDPDKYSILLAHNPDFFPHYAQWGADLVMAGHVHGGLVRIPIWKKGLVSPAVRLFPKYDGGLFREGRSTMLLSRGLGLHTIPIRMFNPGELLVAELLPGEIS